MAQVVAHTQAFEKLNTNIVAISFGTPHWANVWLQETSFPYQLWLDPSKKSYNLYGLTHSFLRSWGLDNLRFYAKAIGRGKRLKGYRGDTNQLGGNFIVDKNGIVQMAYVSKNPTDRPDLSQVLDCLSRLQE